MLNWAFPVLTALLLTFFVFSIYNIPVVVTGFRRLWKSHKKDKKPRLSEGQDLPFVSIIVPMKNEEEVAARLLNALAGFNYPSGKREVIVVDDASTDRTGEICLEYSLSHPEVRVLERATSNTKAGALNFGLKYSRIGRTNR